MNAKLPYTPEDFVVKYVDAMNRWDVELCCMHYEETACLIASDGRVVEGLPAIREIIVEFLSAKPVISCQTALLAVNGGIALHRSNWKGTFVGDDGRRFDALGTGTEIIRRGSDGVWRHAIDIPDPSGLRYGGQIHSRHPV